MKKTVFAFFLLVAVVFCTAGEGFGQTSTLILEGGSSTIPTSGYHFTSQVTLTASGGCTDQQGPFRWWLDGAGTLTPNPDFPYIAVYTAPEASDNLSCASNPLIIVEEPACNSRASRFMYLSGPMGGRGSAYAGTEVSGYCLRNVYYDCSGNRISTQICDNIYMLPGEMACCRTAYNCYDWTVLGGCGSTVSCEVIPYKECNFESQLGMPCGTCQPCTPENLQAFAGGFCVGLPLDGMVDKRGFFGNLGSDCGCTPKEAPPLNECVSNLIVPASFNPKKGPLKISGTIPSGVEATMRITGPSDFVQTFPGLSGSALPEFTGLDAEWKDDLEDGEYQVEVTGGNCTTVRRTFEATSEEDDHCQRATL